jgi:hypothetical protein
MVGVLKIRNELGKKPTFLALSGSVTRRRFREPARAAVVFIPRGDAAGMGACPENRRPPLRSRGFSRFLPLTIKPANPKGGFAQPRIHAACLSSAVPQGGFALAPAAT